MRVVKLEDGGAMGTHVIVDEEFVLSSDSTPQRNKLIDTVRTLDEYETTILQAYANRLIKSREERGA
jgi:hypothetical protein